jgi:hypothetical protein
MIRPAVETALIVAGLAIMLLLRRHPILGDGQVRLDELTLLLQHGTLASGKYSLIGPAFATPLWLLGQVVHKPEWGVDQFNWLVFVLGIAAMYWLLKDHVDRGLLRTFFLLLVAASMFPNATFNFYGELFTVMFVGVGVVATIFGPRLAGWVAVVLGVANTPAAIGGLGLVALKRMLDNRRLRYLLAPVAAVALIGAENTLRRGNPLDSGYESGFTYPIFFGLLGILFSFGKGLIFYAPGLLLPVRSRLLAMSSAGRKLYTVYTLWAAYVLGLVLVYSHWWAWYGGDSWGPRFFLLASLPASLAIAVRLRQPDARLWSKVATLLALVLSCWVGLSSAVFFADGVAACTQGYDKLVTLCAYTPQDSALWHVLAQPMTLGKSDLIYIAYTVIVFGYLALPLAGAIVWQAGQEVRGLTRGWAGALAWRA